MLNKIKAWLNKQLAMEVYLCAICSAEIRDNKIRFICDKCSEPSKPQPKPKPEPIGVTVYRWNGKEVVETKRFKER